MKKNILLKPFYGKIFSNNKVFKADDEANNFFNFKEKIKKYGVMINTIDIKTGIVPDKIVYCDVPYPWELKNWLCVFLNRKKNILFVFEPPIINPFSHFKIMKFLFHKIYTWDDRIVDNKKYFKLYPPLRDVGLSTKFNNYSKKKFLVIINSNKKIPFLLKIFSPKRKELYKERIKAINYFEKQISKDFYLYGKGWNKNDRPSYYGQIKDKFKILSGFKFSLCFENTNADGYISPKIFDCFKAGCVPIYWGAGNIEAYVPKNCFIDFRKFMDYERLINYLNRMSESEYNEYVKAIKKFMHSNRTKSLWFEKGFEQKFLESIQ